jgi:hypothetical protein
VQRCCEILFPYYTSTFSQQSLLVNFFAVFTDGLLLSFFAQQARTVLWRLNSLRKSRPNKLPRLDQGYRGCVGTGFETVRLDVQGFTLVSSSCSAYVQGPLCKV